MRRTHMINTFQGPRQIRRVEDCTVCASALWVFTDTGTSGDPRGAIKLRHNHNPLVASEYGKVGSDVPLCFDCANDAERYKQGLAIASERWHVNNNSANPRGA